MRTSCNDKGVDAQSKSNKSSKQKSSDPIEKKVAFVFLFYLLPQLPLLNLRLMQCNGPKHCPFKKMNYNRFEAMAVSVTYFDD